MPGVGLNKNEAAINYCLHHWCGVANWRKYVHEPEILLILHNRCGTNIVDSGQEGWMTRTSTADILRRDPALLMSNTLSVKILWKVSNPYAWCTYSINNWTRAPLLLFVVQNIIPISSRLKTFNQFSLTLEILVEDGFTHEMSVRLHLEMIKRISPWQKPLLSPLLLCQKRFWMTAACHFMDLHPTILQC